jgi:monofunctional biosynthetic peptidoglycan transglycosylase
MTALPLSDKPGPRAPRRRPWLRVLRWVVGALIVILLVPYVIAPFYRYGQPVSTLMLWRKLTGSRVDRTWKPLDEIAPVLALTVIVAEDAKFCRHNGIDWGELRGAFREMDSLSELRGGSTISQQLAKNLFLWPGRSYVRKVLELPLTLWLELVLPKRRLMEIYLNVAEWGPNGEFGAEAAARRAFRKTARALTAPEAAALAAILPNPIRRSATRPNAQLRRIGGTYVRRAGASPTLAECLRR